MDVLYESELRGSDPVATLATRLAQADPPVPQYAVDLVEGVSGHRGHIDELLAAAVAPEWTVERMPAVDRAVLRLACFELLYRDDVPDPVAIDEAVALARGLSTEDSPRFVNGVLARLLADKRAASAP